MTSSVTHFEIYAEDPAKLAEFYRTLLGWQVEKAPGIDYWRIQTAPGEAKGIGGGLMFRPIPGPRSWVHYLHVQSLDETLEQILGARRCRGATEDRGAEDGLVRSRGRPRGEHLRDLAGRPDGDAATGTGRVSQEQRTRRNTKLEEGKSACVTQTTHCIPRTCSR